MTKTAKQDSVRQAILGARRFSADAIIFHQTVAEVLGVNSADMRCLDIMMEIGSASPKQVADYTGLSSGATTTLIDRLEKAGFIERHPNPNDRRGVTLTLSKFAVRKLGGLFEPLSSAMNMLLSSYSESELEVMNDFFSKCSILWQDERTKLLASIQISER